MSHGLTIPELTDATFGEAVAPGTGLVAVEFSAEWCGPCRIMAPIVEALAEELAPGIRLVQMDGDTNQATQVRYGVRGLPTMLVFRDGELVDRIVGATPKAALRERLARHVRAG